MGGGKGKQGKRTKKDIKRRKGEEIKSKRTPDTNIGRQDLPRAFPGTNERGSAHLFLLLHLALLPNRHY